MQNKQMKRRVRKIQKMMPSDTVLFGFTCADDLFVWPLMGYPTGIIKGTNVKNELVELCREIRGENNSEMALPHISEGRGPNAEYIDAIVDTIIDLRDET